MFNPVNWFEIYFDDMARARRFYETGLGRSLTQVPSPDNEMGPSMHPRSRPVRAVRSCITTV